MKEDTTLFSDWIQSLTVTDVVNIVLMASFVLYIVILVTRTFRDKPEV
ncbi:MAG: hypothetical protein RIM99_20130 [Cyclobacteriaceae bacterium]